jgi:ribosomal protein S18 acetylase RimI-like enzyme
MTSNYQRLLALAESFFDAKNDSEQLSMTEEDRRKLQRLHPATMSEETDENGPIAWVLVFPTMRVLMERFLAGEIGEQSLLHETPSGIVYDAVYLCSALVLDEYRRKGIARRLATTALQSIIAGHPINTIFIWSFSPEGEAFAASVAGGLGLPLRRRLC